MPALHKPSLSALRAFRGGVPARMVLRRPVLLTLTVSLALLVGALSAGHGLSPAASGAGTTGFVATGATATLAVIGDFGSNSAGEAQVASLVAGWAPDAVLGLGDDYYPSAGGTGTGKYDISVGKYYCAFLQGAAGGANCPSGGTASGNRFWSAAGNHDYTDGGGLTPLGNYKDYFPFPSNERYFRVTIGAVDVFVIDSDEALRNATERAAQNTWLESAARASTAPWQVAIFHHPPYSSSSSHGSSTPMRWPFADWGIDLVMSGHDHTYERVAQNGITYLVNGIGGASLYTFGTPVAGSQVRYSGNYGAVRLSASEASLMGSLVTVDGATRDTFSVSPVTPSVVFRDGSSPTGAYAGARDTTLSQSAPATARGGETMLLMDGDDPAGSGQDQVTLAGWDVSSIPAGATITSASIQLTVTNTSTGSYEVYEALRPWTESEATWSQASAGIPWSSPGAAGTGDRGTAVLGTVSAAALGLLNVALNASGVALVQGWVNGGTPNRGFVIANSATTDGADVHSSESATVSARPALSIQYSLPGPTPTPTPIPTPTPTPSVTPTPTPSPTPTPAPTPGSFGKSTPKNNAKVATGAVTLTWRASTNATGYEYCLSTTVNVCSSSWLSTGTARTVTVAAPLTRTSYYWQIRAAGSGTWTYANYGNWWRFNTR